MNFFTQINRERQAALDRQQELARIEAQKNANLALQNNATRLQQQTVGDTANRQQIEEMRQEMLLRENIAKDLVAQGMDPKEATLEAANQAAAIKSQPEIVKATTARRANEFNLGAIPLERELGGASTENAITGQQLGKKQNELGMLTTAARMTSAPLAAQAEDQQKASLSNLNTLKATSAMPFVPMLATEQVNADISGARADTARNVYTSTEFQKLDPTLAAQAKNAEMGSARDAASINPTLGLLLKSGLLGSQPGSLGDALISGTRNAPSPIRGVLSSALQQGLAPTAPAGTNALPARGVLFNINNLKR